MACEQSRVLPHFPIMAARNPPRPGSEAGFARSFSPGGSPHAQSTRKNIPIHSSAYLSTGCSFKVMASRGYLTGDTRASRLQRGHTHSLCMARQRGGFGETQAPLVPFCKER
uniref:Uncharacterized protein n=1 Tax=Knipowitschia caucasica TaxID=637954 RepID=A0AAV2J7U8_KNICA